MMMLMDYPATSTLLFIVILFKLIIYVPMIWQYIQLLTVMIYFPLDITHAVSILPTLQLLYHLLFLPRYQLFNFTHLFRVQLFSKIFFHF